MAPFPEASLHPMDMQVDDSYLRPARPHITAKMWVLDLTKFFTCEFFYLRVQATYISCKLPPQRAIMGDHVHRV